MKRRIRSRNFRLAVLQLEDRVTPATQLLPDLQVLSSYLSSWYIDTTSVPGSTLLRYTTAVANTGAGVFEIAGTPNVIENPDGSQAQVVNQNIAMSDGTTSSRTAGTFTYDADHGHVHFDDFAIARLIARPGGTGVGSVIVSSPKTSFCLLDSTLYAPNLPGVPTTANFVTCDSQIQGIDIGWADIYSSGIEGQSMDITGVPNGDYWLEVEVDPDNSILEANETNNITRIPITISSQPTYGFRVLSVLPVGPNNNPVGAVTVTFNQAVNPATFTPADLSFTGPAGAIAVTSVTAIDAVHFQINFAAQSAVGTYQMTIGPDISSTSGSKMDQNNNGTAGEQADSYHNIFTITAPQVAETSPVGGVAGPVSSIRVTYSKPMLSSSFTAANIVSFTGPGGVFLLNSVTAVTPLAAGGTSAIFDITFNPVSAVGTYTLVLAPTVTDPFGHTVDQNGDGVTNAVDHYTANFAVSPSGTSGPDIFGYSATLTSAPNGSILGRPGVFVIQTNADDAATPVNFGANSFNFYGVKYSGNAALWVSTNGLITFSAGNAAFQNDDLSNTTLPTLAVLWDDWTKSAAAPQVIGLFNDTNGDGKPDQLIIEWNQVPHHAAAAGETGVTFQAILELNTGNRPGNIIYNYLDVSTGNASDDAGASATVGWRASGAGPRLIVSENSGTNVLVGTGKAILISVPQVESITRVGPGTIGAGAADFQITFSAPVTGVDPSDFALTTTGNITGAQIGTTFVTADPNVWQVHIWGFTGAGTLGLNLIDNDSIVTNLDAKLGGLGAGNGSFTKGDVFTVTQAAPSVQAVNIGDGTAQRSIVKQVTVVFSNIVTFAGNPSAAFQLTGPSGNIAVAVDTSLSSGTQTVARLTFSGAGTQFGSLADGRYTLRVIANQISTGGVAMTADDTVNFFRLFGDIDGNAVVNSSDYAAFRAAAYGTDNPAFDFDGNGIVGASDYQQFSMRYLKSV